jgi:hypothetical protein
LLYWYVNVTAPSSAIARCSLLKATEGCENPLSPSYIALPCAWVVFSVSRAKPAFVPKFG